ncbi:MAG TPA: chromate transporter [Candidatus Omnitrophota bacterium]|nr:chromate transporter [Candidatus Omnitrophota bacterium]
MIRLILLAFSFVKIGILGFGGGYAMIPLIQREVQQFGIVGGEFIDILALSQMTPGPIGINTATYTGYKVAGFTGAAVATVSNVLPTFALMLVAAHFFYAFRANRRVELFFRLARPLFIGLIASSALLMMRDIRIWQDYKACGIFLAVFVLLYRYRFSFWMVFILSGAAGLLFY